MKSKRTWKTLLAAALSIAIAVVFMPVFGQVDKASADDVVFKEAEIISTETFALPLDIDELEYPDLYLTSHEYKNGKGDILRITYADNSTVDYYCVDESWNFESEDGKKNIMLAVETWADPSADPSKF